MYLSRIEIENFKGIKELNVDFNSGINIIIGENGSNKTALIDAIRILYSVGKPNKEISINDEDFFIDKYTGNQETKFTIMYFFRGLTPAQEGAFYEFMVYKNKPQKDKYAKIEISYNMRPDKYPLFSYSTGKGDGQKADYNSFELFQHYYLSALRDSTQNLLNTRYNLLGNVIRQSVLKGKTESKYLTIIEKANDELLKQDEVKATRKNINEKLEEINKIFSENKVGLQIEPSNINYILNAIKPFLPFDTSSLSGHGFSLFQNSLGHNNLIYIATVLSDITEKIKNNKIPHFSLLIEEPEAHLHPQLQLSLYKFLKTTNKEDNSQLFISTHSPTLTSKVELKHLILLDNQAYKIDKCFKDRENEKIIEDTTKNIELKNADYESRRKQLERYIDVTKSQLFYAKGVLLVEGISEELLIPAFCKINDFAIEDYMIEMVNVGGVSFYPFLHLFNSKDKQKVLPKKVSIITDSDIKMTKDDNTYPKIKLDTSKLYNLHSEFVAAQSSNRVNNLNSTIRYRTKEIIVKTSRKTLELELVLNNIADTKKEIKNNFLMKYLFSIIPDEMKEIENYYSAFPKDKLTQTEIEKTAIYIWKALPAKAEFAQDLAIHIIDNIDDAKKNFTVPSYITDALNHLKS